MAKIGRNDPCYCGSGEKFKRCCINEPQFNAPLKTVNFSELPENVRQRFIAQQVREAQRVRKFGHVRAPVVIEHQGHKLVAVGDRILWSKEWKTFHDFLGTYIAAVLTRDWGNSEIKKPWGDRHPILQWYHLLCDFQRTFINGDGKVYVSTMTGPVKAYYSLAYDLYTLEHHSLLQKRLIKRLKARDQFQGARYEVYVCAAFVRAGFEVELEDEGAPGTHCEFTANHKDIGVRYSVEAKSRHRPGYLGQREAAKRPEEIQADVYKLLQHALMKQAKHQRVVFVDVNVPPDNRPVFEKEWTRTVAAQLKRLEETQRMDEPWPPAFVFFTNHPYHYVGNNTAEPGHTTLFTGMNIPEFKQADESIITARFPAIKALVESVLSHTEVPHEI
jgi:SEC-C motif